MSVFKVDDSAETCLVFLRALGVVDGDGASFSMAGDRGTPLPSYLLEPSTMMECYTRRSPKVTVFMETFSGASGGQTLESYIRRLLRFGGPRMHECLDVACILLQRLQRLLGEEIVMTLAEGSSEPRIVNVSPAIVRFPESTLFRTLLSCWVLAVKLHSDQLDRMTHYAKVGGIPLKQLNRAEKALMWLLDYRMHIWPGDYDILQQQTVDYLECQRTHTFAPPVAIQSAPCECAISAGHDAKSKGNLTDRKLPASDSADSIVSGGVTPHTNHVSPCTSKFLTPVTPTSCWRHPCLTEFTSLGVIDERGASLPSSPAIRLEYDGGSIECSPLWRFTLPSPALLFSRTDVFDSGSESA
jgi:hypothetical protein